MTLTISPHTQEAAHFPNVLELDAELRANAVRMWTCGSRWEWVKMRQVSVDLCKCRSLLFTECWRWTFLYSTSIITIISISTKAKLLSTTFWLLLCLDAQGTPLHVWYSRGLGMCYRHVCSRVFDLSWLCLKPSVSPLPVDFIPVLHTVCKRKLMTTKCNFWLRPSFFCVVLLVLTSYW